MASFEQHLRRCHWLPAGELTSEVYPSSASPDALDVLYVTDAVGSVAITPNTGAGAKAFRCVATRSTEGRRMTGMRENRRGEAP